MARSDNWRINKSGIMPVEGAQILKALQKVAGAAGLPSDFKVRFATKVSGSNMAFEDNTLMIGAGQLFKEAPIPAELFDVLVGITLHETGHQQIQTDRIWNETKPYAQYWEQKAIDEFQKFVNVGEDIAIESRVRSDPNLAEYDKALFDWAAPQMRDAEMEKLMEVWIEYALGHKSDKVLNLPDELTEPMQQLIALTGWLRKPHNFQDRASAYRSYWSAVKEAILNPKQPPPQQGQPSQDETQGQSGTDDQQDEPEPADSPDNSSNEKEDGEPSDKPELSSPESDSGAENNPTQPPEQNDVAGDSDGDSSAPESSVSSEEDEVTGSKELDRPLAPKPEDAISDELAQAIEDAIETDQEDITDEVAQEFTEQLDDGRIARTLTVLRSRETKTPLIKPDMLLRKRLERIMTIRKRLQTRIMRGEQYGRIDKRHLHRIATDERIFNLRYKFPDGFPNTRILLDLSGSMSGRQADEVLQAAGALQTLVNAEVWSYDHSGGSVNLVRMDEGKLIHHSSLGGGTPSGLGIVGVSLGMKKGGLIIHLTDGEHNVGQTPWSAHWILKKRGIDLVNLLWGRSSRHYSMDGMNYKQLHGLAEFPDALYQILVEQVKLSKMGGK